MLSRGIDLDANRREKRILEEGCVLRSLESAFGASPTNVEIDQRLHDLDLAKQEGNNFWDSLDISMRSEQIRSQVRAFMDADIHRVYAFINDLRTHDTALGNAMRPYEPQVVKVSTDELPPLLTSNQPVLIMTAVRGRGRHMSHLIMDDSGRVLSASDGNVEVNIAPGTYNVIVFQKNAE